MFLVIVKDRNIGSLSSAKILFSGSEKQCLDFMRQRNGRGVDLANSETGRLHSWRL